MMETDETAAISLTASDEGTTALAKARYIERPYGMTDGNHSIVE
jgi:hypothetical protein